MVKRISRSDKAASKRARKEVRWVYHKTPAGTGRLIGHKKKF